MIHFYVTAEGFFFCRMCSYTIFLRRCLFSALVVYHTSTLKNTYFMIKIEMFLNGEHACIKKKNEERQSKVISTRLKGKKNAEKYKILVVLTGSIL